MQILKNLIFNSFLSLGLISLAFAQDVTSQDEQFFRKGSLVSIKLIPQQNQVSLELVGHEVASSKNKFEIRAFAQGPNEMRPLTLVKQKSGYLIKEKLQGPIEVEVKQEGKTEKFKFTLP